MSPCTVICMPENKYKKAIDNLVSRLRSSGYLKTLQMERALRTVPREEFVTSVNKDHAYSDTPLPIGHGQTISAPHMCVIMCEAMKLKPGHRILEIGAGSGYHAALCAELVAPEGASNQGHVYTIEIVESLISFAKDNIKRAGYDDRVTIIHGDGGQGLPEEAPFDRILVVAAAPDIPQPLIDQLAKGGIMLIPVGSRGFFQELILITKDAEGNISQRNWGGVAFVPLTGKFGY